MNGRISLAGRPEEHRQVNQSHIRFTKFTMAHGEEKRKMENRSLTYPEMANELVEYVKDMGFTHVEFFR